MTLMTGRLIAFAASVVLVAAPAVAQTFHSTTQKYRERNPSAATGRSGGAKLSARLLLGKDGKTLVQVTTGELDSSTPPPGSLAKVQVKGFDSTGETMFTINTGPLSGGGYWSGTYSTFAPSQPFQIQGNVRGIDGKRTDVVTLTGSVHKRPDLQAQQLVVPNRARINQPVQMSAVIRELNHNLGARADCVLSIDGQEVDRVTGVWVDSGDTVSCAFSYAFPASGTHNVKVSAVNVQPGDWDTGNNSVEGSVDVVNTITYDWAYAGAWMYKDFSWKWKNYGTYASSSGTGYDWLDEGYDTARDYSGFYYYGYKGGQVAHSVTSLAVSATDGSSSYSFTASSVGCYNSGSDTSSGRTIYWQVYGQCWGYELYAEVWSYAGTVTYFRNGHQRWSDSAGNTTTIYSYNYTTEYAYGTDHLTGAQRTIDVSVTTSDGSVFSRPISFVMTPYVTNDTSPETCSTWTDSYGTQTGCWSHEYKGTQYHGSGYAQGQ